MYLNILVAMESSYRVCNMFISYPINQTDFADSLATNRISHA